MEFLRAITNFSLPPRCAGCGLIVARDNELCTTCWQSLTFLTDEGCALCGVPMEREGQICLPCLAQPPDHDGARAAVTYDEVARTIILKLKHGRKIGLATLIGNAMARHVPGGAVILVPVPLHRWRIWRRGFNQSVLIGRAIAKASGQPMAIDVLQRVKATPLLGGLGAKSRAEKVRGAFAVDPAHRTRLSGKTMILIDDVYTSGATSNACARALKKGGAARVIVLCWARVLLDH